MCALYQSTYTCNNSAAIPPGLVMYGSDSEAGESAPEDDDVASDSDQESESEEVLLERSRKLRQEFEKRMREAEEREKGMRSVRRVHPVSFNLPLSIYWGIPSSDGIPLRGYRLFFFFFFFRHTFCTFGGHLL